MKNIFFVCVENAGRSQMAAAFATYHGNGKAVGHSAGTMPGEQVNPIVVQVMKEKGTDISNNTPQAIDGEQLEKMDAIITMGCRAQDFCPAPLLQSTVDWALEDPKGQPIEKVREIRDEVERRVEQLLSRL